MHEISIKWLYLHNVDLASGAWQELDLLRGRRQEIGQHLPQAISSGVLLRRGALFGAVFPLIALLVVALNRRAATHAQHHSTDNRSIDR